MVENNYFYVVDSGSEANQYMFSDVKKLPNAIQTSNVFSISNPFLRLLNKVHLSTKINKIIDLPGKSIWDWAYLFDHRRLDENTTYWLIITNWSICRFGKSYLEKISRKKNVRLVLIYLDPVNAIPEFYKKRISGLQFSLIYSFDESDCKKYGWIYTNELYSKNELLLKEKPSNDVYFIGSDKGRAAELKQIYDRFCDAGLICDFHIIAEKDTPHISAAGFHIHSRRLSYKEVLDGVSNSKCILEIVQNGQSGMTMRPYEALFYNKRLLTNNRCLEDMPFYNPRYMQIYSTVDEINVSAIMSVETVDYGYHDEYSPISLLKHMPDDWRRSHESN